MIRSRTPEIRDQDDANSSLIRKYTSAVEKVLQTFSTVESWPDNIAFLNRLSKTIQAYPSLPLPRALEISTCLALCLAPQLPSGVHAKTLDLFSHIFSSQQILHKDVSLFMVGLIPVLGYASSTVKVSYVNLLSTFLVPLGERLAEFIRALVLALLPGLEDEHDESFDLCFRLLNDIRGALNDDAFFFGSFWLATMTTTSANRSGSLNYLSRILPLHQSSDQSHVDAPVKHASVGPDSGVFCRALAAGLTDEDLLVQRGFLELLLAYFPLDSAQLLSLAAAEREILLFAATTIVLRKDVSLNRRLWLWLSGPQVSSRKDGQDSQERDRFFDKFARQDLCQAILRASQQEPIRTAKILLSLLDRGDVGGHIIDTVFPAFVEIAYENSLVTCSTELLISIRALFEAVPIEIIDALLSRLCKERNFGLAEFMYETFGLYEEDLLRTSILATFIELLYLGTDNEQALHFAETIALHLTTYDLQIETHIRGEQPEDEALGEQDLGSSWSTACFGALSRRTTSPERYYQLLKIRLGLDRIADPTIRGFIDFTDRIVFGSDDRTLDFVHLSGISEIMTLLSVQEFPRDTIEASKRLTLRLCDACWANLGSTKLRYEISSVHILEKLCRTLTDREAETFISVRVSEDLASESPIEKFAALWVHLDTNTAREILRCSTLLILDSLNFGSGLVKGYILRWLKFAGKPSCLMINFLMSAIYAELPQTETDTTSVGVETSSLPDSLVYHVRLLCNLLQAAGKELLLHYARSEYLVDDPLLLEKLNRQGETLTYLEIIEVTVLQLLRLRPRRLHDELTRNFFRSCSDILLALATVRKLPISARLIVIDGLSYAITMTDFDIQQLFLRTLGALGSDDQVDVDQGPILLRTILNGLSTCRQHPVLQDYLSFVHDFIGLHKIDDVMDISHCIIEQIDLNLIDIDACLTTNLTTVETSTAYENLVLYLDSLELTSLAIVKSNAPKDVAPINGASILPGAFAFVRAPNGDSDHHNVPKLQDISIPLQSTLRVSIGVWNWAANNMSDVLPSVRHIANSLEERSRSLIQKVLQAGAMLEFLEILVDMWDRSSEDNRERLESLFATLALSDAIDIICRHLKGKLNFGTGAKGMKELQVNRSMRFVKNIIERTSVKDISQAVAELSALLRHIVLHSPFSGENNVILTQFVTMTATRALACQEGQHKKMKKDISDSVMKILQLVASTQTSTENDSKVIKTFAKIVVPQLPAVFLDLDRVALLVSYLMVHMLQPQLKMRKLSPDLLELFVQISSLDNVRKSWRKEFQDFFVDTAFFKVPDHQVQSWMIVMSNWVNGDKERIDEYLIKSSPNAPAHLFNSAETERLYSAAQIRRAMVILLSLPRDTMLSKLPTILNRFEDLCNSHIDLQVEALLCIQVVLVRFSAIHLRNYWPLVVTELRAIVCKLLTGKEIKSEHMRAVKSVLETIDLLLYLRPAAFQNYLWIFIDDAKRRVFSSSSTVPETLMDRLLARLDDAVDDSNIQALVAIPTKQRMRLCDYMRDVHMLYHEQLYESAGRSDSATEEATGLVTHRLFNT